MVERSSNVLQLFVFEAVCAVSHTGGLFISQHDSTVTLNPVVVVVTIVLAT